MSERQRGDSGRLMRARFMKSQRRRGIKPDLIDVFGGVVINPGLMRPLPHDEGDPSSPSSDLMLEIEYIYRSVG